MRDEYKQKTALGIAFFLLVVQVSGSTSFASCSQSSSLLVSLRCEVTLDNSDLTFWSSDPSRDQSSAWLLYSYSSAREVGSYLLQAIKTGFAQQSPSQWRVYAGMTLNDMGFVEERTGLDWKSLEKRIFTLTKSIRAAHIRIDFVQVQFPVAGQNPIFSVTGFAAYPPVVFTYYVSDWSECSEPCDGGTQERDVACWGNNGRRDYPLADCAFSLGEAPASTQVCNTGPCMVSEVSQVTARPGLTRTDEMIVTCFPNSASDVQCIAVLGTEESVPLYAEVTDSAVMLRPCAPPSCVFSIYGLVGNTAYWVYCAVADMTQTEFQTVIGSTQPVFTAATNATAVAVSNSRESSFDVTVTLKEVMTAGVDVFCTVIHTGFSLYPSTYTYLKSDVINSAILPLRPAVSLQLSSCTTRTCIMTFDQMLASGANYRADCRTSAGRVVSNVGSTTTASILAMQYVSATSDPKISLRVLLSSASHVVCSLTPVSALVCCPNAPQFIDFKMFPTVPCSPDCTLTFSGLTNSTRYAVWCATSPFVESTLKLFPTDDVGFRFDTPKPSNSTTTPTSTTPPPTDLGPVRIQTVSEVALAGSAVTQSALLGSVIGLAILILSCAFSRSGRALLGPSPDGHNGPALAPATKKLVALDATSLVSVLLSIIVINQARNFEGSTANSAICFFLGISVCLFAYQVVILGLLQFLISREKTATDIIDLQVLGKLHVPVFSWAVASSAGDAELEQAWSTKATIIRREVILVTLPAFIALLVRGTNGIFGLLLLLSMVAKIVMFIVTFTESITTGLSDEDIHTEQIQVITNKRDFGPQ